MKKRKLLSLLLTSSMLFSLTSCATKALETSEETPAESIEETTVEETTTQSKTEETEATEEAETTKVSNPGYDYSSMTPEEIVATLTLEEKAAQMVEPAIYNVEPEDMEEFNYGSILSHYDDWPQWDQETWVSTINDYQAGSLVSSNGIPLLYGQDAVHGVNFASGCVIFPHNVNIGAANDVELTYEMGVCVGSDIMNTNMIWNFAPCVAASQDPRWGRTYESYSSEPSIITPLAVAYSEGLLSQGVVVCPKHFICDGYALYGTGEYSDNTYRLIDRGDAIVSDDVINENLAIYQALIDSGVQTIMISHSSLNGIKMHENAKYIMMLKNEMGFEGFIISDWNSIQNCSGATLEENVILSINSGIDMLMQPDNYDLCMQIIIDAVNNGDISEERIDDAVTRIIRVKMEAGLFDDPYLENVETSYEFNSDYSREVARKLAEESLVPLKADGGLTLEPGSRVFVLGPAADDSGVLLGGWTYSWTGLTDQDIWGMKVCPEGTTILEGLKDLADEYELEIVTNKNEIDTCDVILLCLGEQTYAEWTGDAEDLSITGDLGLDGNLDAIELAKEANLPTITLLVAGRNVIIEDYINDWDSVIMCYLPGSEGGAAIANALVGKCEYTGTLAMPYYKSEADIDNGNVWLPVGFTAAK